MSRRIPTDSLRVEGPLQDAGDPFPTWEVHGIGPTLIAVFRAPLHAQIFIDAALRYEYLEF